LATALLKKNGHPLHVQWIVAIISLPVLNSGGFTVYLPS
jgi:hypothetical protein